MRKSLLVICLISLLGLFACIQKEGKIELKSGDLLFRGASSEQLSQAIDKVTQTSADTHFSHVGLVERTDSGIFVLHASPEGGSCIISINEFLHTTGDSVTVVAYRLKDQWQKTIPGALQKARQMLGKPYNFSYIMTDTAHYCSEFIFLAFAEDSVFEMNPMTFKDPKTGEFYPTWVDYYQKMGLPVPEGKPGCNPNGMAASDKLKRLGILNPKTSLVK